MAFYLVSYFACCINIQTNKIQRYLLGMPSTELWHSVFFLSPFTLWFFAHTEPHTTLNQLIQTNGISVTLCMIYAIFLVSLPVWIQFQVEISNWHANNKSTHIEHICSLLTMTTRSFCLLWDEISRLVHLLFGHVHWVNTQLNIHWIVNTVNGSKWK